MLLKVDIEKKLGNFILKSNFATEDERFALLGASGCGKSMTLKCIAGIEKPDRGRIVLGDRVLFDSDKRIDIPARNRKVGYLFQDYALFPNMTVMGNIYTVADDRAYADELIERFGLTDVADQYPAELSGGQSQRTALARMLVTRPEVLLLDEPFSALDNYMRTRMEHEILDIMDEFNGPTVLVTHDRNEAYRLSGRIGVMDGGRIVETDDREAFFEHPVTVAAARLTGCKNISRIKSNGDGTYDAMDWGIRIKQTEEDAGCSDKGNASCVGYRAHFLTFMEKNDMGQDPYNVIEPEVVRVIEDTFSVVVCIRQKGNMSKSPDSILTWIVGKDKWEGVKDCVLKNEFSLKLDPKYMMFLI